jgi:hypothetical protein
MQAEEAVQIKLDDLTGQAWLMEMFLYQEGIKVDEEPGLALIIGSCQTTKSDKPFHSFCHGAMEIRWVHGVSSGQSRAT